MSPSDRHWFPTEPGQSAVAYVLTVMLLCNLTVLALMVGGEIPVAGMRSAPDFAAYATPTQSIDHTTQPEHRVPEPPATNENATLNHTPAPHPQQAPKPHFEKPAQAQIIHIAAEPKQPAATSPNEPKPTEQAEPPTKFFGLDLD